MKKVTLEDGAEVWQIPEGKIDMLRKDALWANTRLDVGKVRYVPVTSVFKTGAFVAE